MSEKETNNKNKTDKKDTDKKEEAVPNSVIIYIKTRIPNFYKLNYEPYMSVPKNKNHTVYFDPLIKYYETPIKNIPGNASKDAVLTQFFNAPEFDTMINRILSDFRKEGLIEIEHKKIKIIDFDHLYATAHLYD